VFNYGTEYYDPANLWQTIQDFSTSSSCTYTFMQPGSYVLVAWASSAPGIPTAGVPAIMGRSIHVSGTEGILLTGLQISPAGSVQVGDAVTFTATATHSADGDIYYRFDLIPNYGTTDYDPNNNYETIQDFSTTNTSTQTFTESGSYIIVVWASATPSFPTDVPPSIIGGSVTVE
jgi:hypothetical protein